MSGKTGKIILSIVGLIFLVAGAGVGVYLVQQQQLLQKKAVVPGGTADILLSPQSQSANVGDTIPVDIRVNSNNIAVSTLNVRLMFPNDDVLNYPVSIIPNQTLINDHQWRFDTNSYESGGNIIIDISAFNTSIEGYTANGDVTYATIQLVGKGNGTASLQFDPGNTLLLEKSTGNDILDDNQPAGLPTGTYSIGGGTLPTNTPIPQPTSPPAATNTPIPGQPTNTPVPPTNTPEPTATTAPGQPTNTPGPAATATPGPQGIAITSPVNNAQLTDTTPTFSGTALAGSRITITVNSSNPVTGTATSNSSGNWTWTPTTALALGSHTANFVSYDLQDNQSTATVTFSIVAAGTATGTDTTTTDGTALPQAGSVELTLALSALGILFLLTGGLLAFKRH